MDERALRQKLAQLRLEHHDLDVAIEALTQSGGHDQLQLARMKKRKLRLKDQIAAVEDILIPDIIA
jgi:hypothetical protein